MIKIGVIGYGYWGPNIVRNFVASPNCLVTKVCDINPELLTRVNKLYPSIETSTNVDDILTSSEIDAVCVITPVSTHYEFALKALQNGKHVFVEKPFTLTSNEAKELVELADRKNLTIMVDHTFLFTGAVRKISDLIEEGTLGRLLYYDSTRVNLGLFQHDVNVVWDLAPHDLSIMDYLISQKAEAIVATGATHFSDLEEIAYITIYFANSIIAHVNVNWISPVKIRMTLIGGEKKMLVWNDLEPDEKIRIYDKGVDVNSRKGVYDLLVSYRSGDMLAPKVQQTEALRLESDYFVECIDRNQVPFNDGQAGLRVVQMLEATDKSLREKGKLIKL
jgi:predicted dehydrogenase